MELKEFAETILFGDDLLKSKLFQPESLSDNNPYLAHFKCPKSPGRPQSLSFQNDHVNQKTSFPNRVQLEQEKYRALLLHFFANHELLAMELMALALLSFPDAPSDFRMGIANTIIEEQKHMNLYRIRMQELGSHFGEIPVNDFFWKSLSHMKSPMDYVTQMSMTFEQANLDYAYFYRDIMQKIGDKETALILDTIYKEEIGHVKYGVRWFNRWRDPTSTDWDEYIKHIHFPLSPARAKGIIFLEDARRQAGFSEKYIDHLSVYSASKGRPPFIYYFNPACEAEIAHLKEGFTASKVVKDLQDDFSSLPVFLASSDDLVFVDKKPSISFLKTLKRCGFQLAEIKELPKKNTQNFKINQDIVGNLCPWGWSPESISFLKNFKNKLTQKNKFCHELFKEGYFENNIKPLFSKTLAANISFGIYKNFEEFRDILPPLEHQQKVCVTIDKSLEAIKYFFNNFNTVVVKAPFSSSGQTKLILKNSNLKLNEYNFMINILSNQGSLIIEPWFDKILDFSYQFKCSLKEENSKIGMTRFLTDTKGRYLGTYLGKNMGDLDETIIRFIYNPISNIKGLSFQTIFSKVVDFICDYIHEYSYEGPIGADVFIYKDRSSLSGFRVKFISEINPRFTMGRIALELEKRVVSHSNALWIHLTKLQIMKKGYSSFEDFVFFLQKEHPLILTEEEKPQIKLGVLMTTDYIIAKSFISILCVGHKAIGDILCLI